MSQTSLHTLGGRACPGSQGGTPATGCTYILGVPGAREVADSELSQVLYRTVFVVRFRRLVSFLGDSWGDPSVID